MYQNQDQLKNKFKEELKINDMKYNNRDNRGRLQNVDPRMQAYMGRLYVTKDKNSYAEPVEHFENKMNSTRFKFKEYVHTKTKKEIMEEIEMKNAAITLLKLFDDLKRMKR